MNIKEYKNNQISKNFSFKTFIDSFHLQDKSSKNEQFGNSTFTAKLKKLPIEKSENHYCLTSTTFDLDTFIKKRKDNRFPQIGGHSQTSYDATQEIDFTAEEEKISQHQKNNIEDELNFESLIGKLDSWDTEHVFEPNDKLDTS